MISHVQAFLLTHAVGLLGSGLLVSLAAHVVPVLVDRFLTKELAHLGSIEDADLKQAGVSLVRYIDRNFPSGGAVMAVQAAVKAFPELAPVSGPLTTLAIAVVGTVKRDLDQAAGTPPGGAPPA